MFGFCSPHRRATERFHDRYFKRGLQTGSGGVFLAFSPLFIGSWSYDVYDLREPLQNHSSANLFSNTLENRSRPPLGTFRCYVTIVAGIWNGERPCPPSFKDGSGKVGESVSCLGEDDLAVGSPLLRLEDFHLRQRCSFADQAFFIEMFIEFLLQKILNLSP